MITDSEVGLYRGYQKDLRAVAFNYQAAIHEAEGERNVALGEVRRLQRQLVLQHAETRAERLMRRRAQIHGK